MTMLNHLQCSCIGPYPIWFQIILRGGDGYTTDKTMITGEEITIRLLLRC